MANTFTVEQYAEAKVAAKELGINPVGKTKQALVDMVNAVLALRTASYQDGMDQDTSGSDEDIPATKKNEATAQEKKEKWHANGYGYNKGDRVTIISKTIEKKGEFKEILQEREAEILGPSTAKGFVRALLIDPETGEKLNCPITLDLEKIYIKQDQEVMAS